MASSLRSNTLNQKPSTIKYCNPNTNELNLPKGTGPYCKFTSFKLIILEQT